VSFVVAVETLCDASVSLASSSRYGDSEYDNKEYDRAIDQYINTIGHVEASYVIRKFLDAQRIHNLTKYLEALHERKFAGPDHTTLLLNCYTKLKEDDKLRRFIRGERGADESSRAGIASGAGGGSGPLEDDEDEVNFQVDTAISVLRDADYLEDALYLAQKHNEHEWYGCFCLVSELFLMISSPGT
jgi:vacuolar protein sorting-associated protein 11